MSASSPGAAPPLDRVGVIVTRPARQAAGLARQLAVLGATPIIFPAIVILPPEDRAALERAHAALPNYDLAFFVSANAAEYGVPAVGRWPRRLPAYAPGPGTAAALVAAGLTDVTIPTSSFDSEGLLALPALADVDGRRAVIFRGDGGREVLAESLRARGATVDQVCCYRRSAPKSGADGLIEVLREGRAHALTLTSSEGLDNLLAVLDEDGRRRLRAIPAFVPHPRIAERARAAGFTAVATDGADAGLIGGLLEWFSAHPIVKP